MRTHSTKKHSNQTGMFKPVFVMTVFLTLSFTIFFNSNISAQTCPNVNFSMGNFTGWQGRTGTCCPINLPTPGFVLGRHTIITAPGTDVNTCGGLVLPAPGFTRVARLGNPVNGAQAEGLSYTFLVDPMSALFVYTYAVVMQDPGHSAAEQPRFELQVRDQFNNVIPCTFYEVAAGAGIPGFNTCGAVVWKNWEQVGVDLTAYMGQTVTIEARTGDCDLGGHYGYAYLVGQCQPLQINVAYCAGAPSATLTAPSGFSSYLWSTGQTTQTVVIPNPPPTVTCTITSVTGCQAILTANIVPVTVTGTVTAQTNVNCFGGSNGSATVSPSGGTGPYTYAWAPSGGTAATATGLAAGNYTVTITESGNNCTGTVVVNITQPAAPLALTSTATNVSCFGGNNGAVDLTVNGGTPGYTYNWSTGAGTQDISGLIAGVYTVTVTDANGCTSTHSRTVTQPAAALNVTGVSTNILCFGGATGAVNITVTGGTAPYTFNWSTGAGTEDITGLTAGTYTVLVTDANGCTNNSFTTTLTQPAAALAVTGIVTNVNCFGANTGSINITPTGGTAPYIYLWSNGATTQDLTALAPGTYGVTITDANGCTNNSYSATITQPPAPIALTSTATNVSCFGGNNGAVDLTVNGGTPGYTYNWSTGAGTQDIGGLLAGVYTVTVTDANGCTATHSRTVTQPAAALAVIGVPTNINCFGGATGAVNITVSGGTAPYSFNWSTGAGTEDISGLTAGTYTVLVTDANGCTNNSFTTTLTQPAAALAVTGLVTNVNCFGANNGSINITPTGGTAPYTYLWTNGATTQDLTALAPGTYGVTITDANGCTNNSYSATITQPAAGLSVTGITTNISCFGGNTGAVDITVNGGTSPYTYNWSTGAGTQDISGLVAGNYSVTITDANGCTITHSTSVTQPAAGLTITGVGTNILCNGGTTGAVNITPAGGTAPYSFNWSTGAGTEDITGLIAGNYTVTVTDANGCTNTYSITLTQPAAALSVTGTSTNINCFGGTTGSIDITPAGGTGPYTYSWTNGATTQDITNLGPGTYGVTITDANGCTNNSYSATITQPAAGLVATAIVTNVSCFGLNNGAIDLAVNGGTPGYTYNWSTGSGSQDISGLFAGTYSVTATDANGCTVTFSTPITQPAAAIAVTGITTNINCNGGATGAINITVTGGTAPYGFIWSTGAGTEDISGLTAGNYTVLVTDANGCTNNIYAATLTQPASPLAVSGIITNVNCFGGGTGSIDLNPSGGTAPYTYLWTNGATTQDLSGLAPGLYGVTVTDANGCTNNSYSATISQPGTGLTVTGVTTNINCFGQNTGAVDITVSGGTPGYSYNWSTGSGAEDISNLFAGNYTVTVYDASGCTSTYSTSVTQPAAALAVSGVSTNINCFGGATGAINLTVTGGTPAYSFNWSTGSGAEDLTGLIAGTYTVTVIDANGCTNTSFTATLTQPAAALAVSGTSTNVNCFGANSGSINITPTGGTTPYTYLWTNGATTEDLNGIGPGSYGVTITDANGCTNNSFTANISQPAAALSVTGITTNISCFGGNNGAVDITVNGGTTPYSYNWTTGAGTQDISGLLAGNYAVTVTDANGCTATFSTSVTQPPANLSVTGIATNINCFGGNTGGIDITPAGGSPGYTYNWSTGAGTQDVAGLIAGPYTVTVTDANGCTVSYSATLTQPAAALAVNGTSTNVNCFNGSNGTIDITPTGGTGPYTYLWNTGAGTQDLNGLIAGTYNVTVTDANGCTNNAFSATITQPVVGVSITGITTNVNCFSTGTGSIDITPSGGTPGYTYNWSTGAGTQDVSGLLAGNYSVTVTDANGCTSTYSATITQPSSLVVVLGNSTNISCFGGNNGSLNIIPSGGTPGYTFIWSNGATTQNIAGLTVGTYSVVVTDANGCTASYTNTITQPAAAVTVTGITTNVSCFGGNTGAVNITPSGGTPGYTYNWSTGAGTQDISGLPVGTYTVTVYDAMGCSNTSFSATVTQPAAALAVTGTSTNINCFGGNTGSVDITPTGGTPGYTYNWSTGAGTQDISGLSAGTYTVLVTDANGCTNNSYSVTITQPAAALGVTGTSTNILCYGGSTGTIDLTVNGGTPGYTYNWSTGASTQDLAGIPVGTYTVTVTDANGCTNTSFTTTLTQPQHALTVAGLTTNVSCYGTNLGSINVSTVGGTPPYTFLWNTGATTEDLSNLSPGTYSLTVTDANGCVDNSFSTTISQPSAALGLNGVTINPACLGSATGSINITPSGGVSPYIYNWSTGADSEDIFNLNGGTYSVTVTDANGCTIGADYTLVDPPGVIVTPTVVSSSCFGILDGSISLVVTGGVSPYNYLWSNGSTAPAIFAITAGNYSVTVTDANGCTTTASYVVPSTSLLNVNMVPDSVYLIWLGESVDLNAYAYGGTGNLTYSWNPPQGLSCTDCSNPTASPTINTQYAVTVTDENGCIATATAFIELMSAMYVPNTFTPNGDGTNDFFNAYSESVKKFSMRIFDRWGEEVFASANINVGWNGLYKGLEAKQDVYVYRIEATFLNGKYQELIGQVNLIR